MNGWVSSLDVTGWHLWVTHRLCALVSGSMPLAVQRVQPCFPVRGREEAWLFFLPALLPLACWLQPNASVTGKEPGEACGEGRGGTFLLIVVAIFHLGFVRRERIKPSFPPAQMTELGERKREVSLEQAFFF